MVGEKKGGVGQRRRSKGTGWIQRLDEGRYRLRVFVGTNPVTSHPRQVTRTVQAKNQTEARTMLERLRAKVAAVEPSGSTATVRTLLQEWLAHAGARGRAPKTLHEARRSAETVIFPALGDVPLRDLTARHLDELYRTLSTGEGRARPLKATSIRRHHAVLSAALGQAVRWGRLEQNPAARAQPPELGQAELQVPTPAEVSMALRRHPDASPTPVATIQAPV
jgi:integrase